PLHLLAGGKVDGKVAVLAARALECLHHRAGPGRRPRQALAVVVGDPLVLLPRPYAREVRDADPVESRYVRDARDADRVEQRQHALERPRRRHAPDHPAERVLRCRTKLPVRGDGPARNEGTTRRRAWRPAPRGLPRRSRDPLGLHVDRAARQTVGTERRPTLPRCRLRDNLTLAALPALPAVRSRAGFRPRRPLRSTSEGR